MLWIKVGMLILYGIVAYVAFDRPLTILAQMCQALLIILVFGHGIECYLYQKQMKDAPGNYWGHLVQVFFFGVAHKMIMDQDIRDLEL